ncbi:MAG: ATP-dependent DNA helicase [Lachnospiraceae bacterium]|nr:ATP-dependent DNA helicase [Lachnospiraceae bacterium]
MAQGLTDRENGEVDQVKAAHSFDEAHRVRISVRGLVEFILRHGDLDNSGGYSDPDAMQEGTRLHKKIQKSMGSFYAAEVPMTMASEIEYDGDWFEITVEGRADGVMTLNGTDKVDYGGNDKRVKEDSSVASDSPVPCIVIDEIKCVYRDLVHVKEIRPLHRAQAMCYASQYVLRHNIPVIGIQLTYCNIETEAIKRFREDYTKEELSEWYSVLLREYAKWVSWQYQWGLVRDKSMKALVFPFEYRPGQKELAASVYRTILREKKIFIEAPTGVGKTVSTLFPSIKAFGEGLVEKIFYLTAKTITRTVAEETFRVLKAQGLKMKLVTLTSKEKICVLEKPDCNPAVCERAKGHFDRVNDAVYDLLTHEAGITRELILQYAAKYSVCPFEMCLDVTTWADGVICDYNYVFDPKAALKRFFAGERKNNYVFLVDEAHNLVERARDMYSAALYKEDFLAVKHVLKEKSVRMTKQLDACNSALLKMKRECDEVEVWQNAGELPLMVMRLIAEYEEFLQEHKNFDGREAVLQLYFDLRHFMNIHDRLDDNYLIYSDYAENGDFRLTLKCMDPSTNLVQCLKKGRSAVFFSATLLPVRYYLEQLGGNEEDYAVYAPTPFAKEKRLLMVAADVSTKYSMRGEEQYGRIVGYIEKVVKSKNGNYMIFFPSYQMMELIYERAKERIPNILLQQSSMTEQEREDFLGAFVAAPKEGMVGFCVMGGIFSEGIDLKSDRLIGTVIVGTGLPMVCNERELFRGFFDRRNGQGFDYAYLYNGMNKVQQSAGRVIRTVEDEGIILLLDERFLGRSYQELFPREWFPFETVRLETVGEKLGKFWAGRAE